MLCERGSPRAAAGLGWHLQLSQAGLCLCIVVEYIQRCAGAGGDAQLLCILMLDGAACCAHSWDAKTQHLTRTPRNIV